MTGVAWSFEEPSAAARVVKDFAKENEKLKVKAGLLEARCSTPRRVENQLATLPSKDEARAMLLATLMAPAQRFVMLLNAPGARLRRRARRQESQGLSCQRAARRSHEPSRQFAESFEISSRVRF